MKDTWIFKIVKLRANQFQTFIQLIYINFFFNKIYYFAFFSFHYSFLLNIKIANYNASKS